uniref:Uncharacterized protein n=1 Tax=Steinernema glaseri TaxID=37863 RepID=A0A1I7XZ61_9BILA
MLSLQADNVNPSGEISLALLDREDCGSIAPTVAILGLFDAELDLQQQMESTSEIFWVVSLNLVSKLSQRIRVWATH